MYRIVENPISHISNCWETIPFTYILLLLFVGNPSLMAVGHRGPPTDQPLVEVGAVTCHETRMRPTLDRSYCSTYSRYTKMMARCRVCWTQQTWLSGGKRQFQSLRFYEGLE